MLGMLQGCSWWPFFQSAPADAPGEQVASNKACTIGVSRLSGTTYPSQKIEFADPVSGNSVWRMTTDGAQHGVTHSLQDQTARETYQWSPDSAKICYTKTGHPSKPDGFYFADVVSGVETFVAPGPRLGACAFSKSSNELFVGYRNGSRNGRQSEVHAYDLDSFGCRVVAEFPEASVGQLSLNADGTLMGVHLITSQPDVPYGDSAYTFEYVIMDVRDSSMLPKWQVDGVPDETAQGDAFYWHPSDPDRVRAMRDGERGIWNVHTLEKTRTSSMTIVGSRYIPSAHGCWSMDGKVWFWSNGHVDCYPQDVGTGLATRIVIERNGALYFSEMWNFIVSIDDLLKTERPPPWDPNALLALTYGANAMYLGHPHTQFSNDGRYVAFISDMGNTVSGSPEGGKDPRPHTTDLFVVVMP